MREAGGVGSGPGSWAKAIEAEGPVSSRAKERPTTRVAKLVDKDTAILIEKMRALQTYRV